MRSAQQRWPFLTHFDLSTIKNEIQLRSIVTSIREAQARRDVQAWAEGKEF